MSKVPRPLYSHVDPDLERLARHQLAAALYNYHRVVTGTATDLVGYLDLTDSQRAFYDDWAIDRAMQAIWKG